MKNEKKIKELRAQMARDTDIIMEYTREVAGKYDFTTHPSVNYNGVYVLLETPPKRFLAGIEWYVAAKRYLVGETYRDLDLQDILLLKIMTDIFLPEPEEDDSLKGYCEESGLIDLENEDILEILEIISRKSDIPKFIDFIFECAEEQVAREKMQRKFEAARDRMDVNSKAMTAILSQEAAEEICEPELALLFKVMLY